MYEASFVLRQVAKELSLVLFLELRNEGLQPFDLEFLSICEVFTRYNFSHDTFLRCERVEPRSIVQRMRQETTCQEHSLRRPREALQPSQGAFDDVLCRHLDAF